MAATSYNQLFEFTGYFEAAAKAALLAIGTDVTDPRSPETLERSAKFVSFTPGASDGGMVIATDNTPQYNRYTNGELLIRLEWPRMEDGDALTEEQLFAAWQTADLAHRTETAKVRALFRESARPLTLTFYEVTRLQPAGEVRGINPDTGCDTIDMRWTVDFSIIPSAWPVPVVP